MVRDLFVHLMSNPIDLPDEWQPMVRDKKEHSKARMIADYIAGMTDRYAAREYRRLFSVEFDG